jgi:adenine deaminase
MSDCQVVALEGQSADVVVAGGRVLLPGRDELTERAVAIAGEQIVAVTDDPAPLIGPSTDELDADGQVVVPGFIDAHTHVDLQQPYERAYQYSLAGGTTAVVSEAAIVASALGPRGVDLFLDATEALPVDVFVTLPPQAFFDTFEPAWVEQDDGVAAQFMKFLTHDRVVGVGETDWIHVVGRDSPVDDLYDAAREEGRKICGHGAGCRDEKLRAFASIVDNDHEAISGSQFRARLDNGLHAIGREGSIRDDVGAFAEVVGETDLANLSLSTDGRSPPDLLEYGHMEHVLRRAIEEGVDPLDAIRVATESPARHFGLSDRGRIEPGAVADLVVLSDLEAVTVETVLADGEVVVRDGDPTVGPRPYAYPDDVQHSLSLPDSAAIVQVSPDVATDGAVRAIERSQGIITEETTVRPAVRDGSLQADPDADVLKAVVLNRRPGHGADGFAGFLSGYGLERGAIATTLAWEIPGAIAVGASDEAIRRAFHQLETQGGGYVVVDDGSVESRFACPIAGVLADRPIEASAREMETVAAALSERGAPARKPLLGVSTLTFPGIPSLRLSFSGYADVRRRRTVGLTPD